MRFDFGNGDKYFMKGYMLAFVAPETKKDSKVLWTVKKGGVEKGTFHSGGSWINYFPPLNRKPEDRAAFWRSDYEVADPIAETYVIKCEYTDPAGTARMATRQIQSRELNPDDAEVRDKKNTDTYMVQLAVIQIFGLDKGRLNQWEPGLYRKNGGSPPFYNSTRKLPAPYPWSKIADEIWNVDKFILGSFDPSNRLQSRQIKAIWDQLKMILEAGDIGAVRLNDRNVADDINGSGLMPPMGFTAEQIVKGICRKEDGKNNPNHSYTKLDHLAINNIRVGEAPGAGGNVYTDWGIGFAAIQPYNAGGKNLYNPNENLFRCAQIFKEQLTKVPARATGPNAQVWYACFRYNQGNVTQGVNNNDTPQSLRGRAHPGAVYADKVFEWMGITPPDGNNE